MMRYFFAAAFCVALTSADTGQLPQLDEKHRVFEMRDLLQQPGSKTSANLMYRAIITSRFGHEREGVDQLRAFLATKPVPELERKAHYELSSALTRLSKYAEAASELTAALRTTAASDADHTDSENVRSLLESLRDVEAQTVEFSAPTPVQARRNELGLWAVPVQFNSQRGEWILDTGANFSTVTESEARRMGLVKRDVNGYARGYTEAKNSTRLAVARELRFGSARLHNVMFLVLADQALFIAPVRYQIHGILGLPALRALGCLDISKDGAVRLDCSTNPPKGPANIFFDGLNPIVQVRHSGHNLQMMLDTGASATSLYPSFRDALTQAELSKLSNTQTKGFSGAGGSEQNEASFVPSIQFDILGRTVFLQNIALLSHSPAGMAGYRDGTLGIDAVANGFRLDFRAMQFTLK